MKIGIDARLYFQTGVGVYLRNLLYYLQKISNNERFYIYIMKNDSPKIEFENNRFIKREVNEHWHSFSEQVAFGYKLYCDNLDLMHFTYFSYPVIYRRPFISTIHDLTPLLFKTGRASTRNKLIYGLKHKALQYILSSQVKNSRKIITPTETVKKQLSDIYGSQYSSKIESIYEGVDYQFGLVRENSDLAGEFRQPFFIYVGNFYPHKNIERLIEAFADLKDDYRLILLGPNDYFSRKILQMIDRLGQEKRILLRADSGCEDLVFFYKHAAALIHPSLSEGFGLPIVEAAYHNLPIIASNIDVFKELLGNRYLCFDPNSVDNIKNKLKEFIDKKPKFDYQDINKKFSFPEMTKKTLLAYKKSLL